jgi:hypothetical protein
MLNSNYTNKNFNNEKYYISIIYKNNNIINIHIYHNDIYEDRLLYLNNKYSFYKSRLHINSTKNIYDLINYDFTYKDINIYINNNIYNFPNKYKDITILYTVNDDIQ